MPHVAGGTVICLRVRYRIAVIEVNPLVFLDRTKNIRLKISFTLLPNKSSRPALI